MWEYFLAPRAHLRGLVVEGVCESDQVDVARERGVDDEAHRHVAPLVEAEVLRREAEALGLMEVSGHFGRGDVGYRLGDAVAAAQVSRVELRRVELARMHPHGAHHRTELEGAGAGDVREELDRHPA